MQVKNNNSGAIALRLLCVFLAALSCHGAAAQTPTANYVKTETMLTGNGTQKQTSVQYYDKKGRPSQLLSNAAGNGTYLRTYTEYDSFGRVSKSSMPMVSSSGYTYNFPYDMAEDSRQTYDGDANGWTVHKYDSQGRALSVMGPGYDWHDDDRAVRHTYGTNKANSVLIYEAPLDGSCSLTLTGRYYSAGELYSETIKDEDWHSVEIFTNRLGQKVLERRDGNTDTYFVYDDLGHLRFVLTPKYQQQKYKDICAYEYRYDERGRMVKKILPGCQVTQYWYDSADRLMFMQDASLRGKGLYRFYMYDALGRMCVQGTCTDCNRGGYRTDAVFSSTGTGIANTGYSTHKTWFVKDPVIEVVNYYDNYDFLSGTLFRTCPALQSMQSVSSLSDGKTTVSVAIDRNSTHGLLTGSVSVSSSGGMMYSTVYYDNRGRAVQSNTAMPDGSVLRTASSLSFTGQPNKELTTLEYRGTQHTSLTENEYERVSDRTAKTTHSYNGGFKRTTAVIGYDGTGRVVSLQRGQDTPAATYTHNIRGWLKNLNDVGFWERILYTYNEIIDGGDSYTGNIGNLMWRNQNDTIDHNYCFYYDGEGRLDGAYYSAGEDWTEDMDRYNLKINSYDLNGNILSLKRNGRKSDGSYGLIDDLTMSYVGNRLIRVVDAADPVVTNGSMDFKDGSDTGVDYTYNASGALTSDLNKGISGIDYDINGNMSKVTFSNGNTTEYVYSQSGAKQRVIHGTVTALPFAEPGISTAEAASVSRDTTEYIGDFVFRNGVLDRLLFRGGYMDIAGGVPRYHYFATDHLGSVRTVYGEDGVAEQLLTYDLFGGIIPELSTGMGMQPYGYNGKELDHTHGLDWYDYGARYYDSPIGRWTTMDPLCEKYYNVSPYVYCLNNPMRLVDYKGMAPGDFFLTVDKAAIDFGLYYNDNSIRERTEYGSTIIKVVNKKGQKGYTYTVANRGNKEGVTLSQAPFGYKTVAEIHTHGHCTENDDTSYYDNDFSGMPRDDEYNIDDKVNLKTIKDNMDIGNANRRQRDSYLVTPNGSLKKYSPKTGKVTLLSTGMPSDYNAPDRKNNKSSFIETNPINADTEFLQILKILTYGVY